MFSAPAFRCSSLLSACVGGERRGREKKRGREMERKRGGGDGGRVTTFVSLKRSDRLFQGLLLGL